MLRIGKVRDEVLSRPWYVEDLSQPEGARWSWHKSHPEAVATVVARYTGRRVADGSGMVPGEMPVTGYGSASHETPGPSASTERQVA